MKYKNYSNETWAKIEAALDAELKASPGSPVAAFDADGTLWDTDLGESFFQYQIKKNLLPEVFTKIPGGKDPWRYYRDWKESGDPRPAYLWLAQIHAGHPLTEVQKWAEDHVKSISPLPIFQDQKKLIELLQSNGVQVYVVTASISWSVEPGAARFGIPREQVLGVRTKVTEGIITADGVSPITYREGKLAALLAASGGTKPFLASGNTMGDFALLEGAKNKLVVGAAKPEQELFKTEEHLRTEAAKNRWLVHQF